MDYFEGLFLGKLWSDTDFENRRHVTLFILYGLFIDALILLTYFTGKTVPLLNGTGTLKIILFVILALLKPFICFRYYRMPLWGKILVLLENLYMHMLMVGFTVSSLLPKLTVKSGDLQAYLIDYLNSTLENYTQKFVDTAGSFSTVFGVVAGGLHVMGICLLFIAAAVLLPGIIYLAYRLVQYGYDWVIARLVIRKFFAKRK